MSSKADHAISFSPAFVEVYDDLAIGTFDAGSIDRNKLSSRLNDLAVSRLAIAASLERDIMEHVETYERFFEKFGIVSPLRRQFKNTREKGLPNIDPIVRLLLLAEMTTGILMGVHDKDSIRGAITFDTATEGESFEGMRAEVQCRRDEIVARDEHGIIFSYLQGADRHTCVGPQTTSVVYFAFGVPSLPNDHLVGALSIVAEAFENTVKRDSPTIHAAHRLD